MFSAGNGVSSVDAWYSTTIDIEEVLSNTPSRRFPYPSWRMWSNHLTLSTATSFAVFWEGLDLQHGFPGFTSRYREVQLRFQLATGLGGSSLDWEMEAFSTSSWFLVSLSTHLGADIWNSMQTTCNSCDVDTLLAAAPHTVYHVKVVGQEALLPVKLVLGAAGLKKPPLMLLRLEPSPWGFHRMLGMVCSNYLPAGLLGCGGSAFSINALSAFRAAVVRAVWSKNLSMTNTPALLSSLDGPWGSDPAFFFFWSRFGQL